MKNMQKLIKEEDLDKKIEYIFDMYSKYNKNKLISNK